MSNPTFEQARHVLNLFTESGATLESIQALVRKGLLSDLLKAENPDGIDREKFRIILGFEPSYFTVQMGNTEIADQIADYLRANGFNYVHEWITQVNFPIYGNDPNGDEIVLVDPGKSFTEAEGFAILTSAGLKRPTAAHALRFAMQHGMATTSKTKPYIIFLHEAWVDPDRDRRVLSVDRDPQGRGLGLSYPDGGFDDHCVLAGVRPRKQPSVSA
jgi:hypothetical protein